jgi:AraC-like DNA-binding protein
MSKAGTVVTIKGLGEAALHVVTRYLCPPHFHDTYSVNVFHAPVTVWCRGELWEAGPGQVVVLEPREVHRGTPQSRSCRQDVIFPEPKLLADLFGSEEPMLFPRPVLDDPELAAALSAAAEAEDREALCDSLRTLFERYGVPGRPRIEPQASSERLRSAISEALELRVAETCRIAGYSPSHFSRQVRASVGLSPRDFRRQQRVQAARTLIENGEELSYCAFEVGFSDQAHMTRQMRSLLGVTPGSLRRRLRSAG